MAGERNSRCVLVCEDDPAMLRIFQFILRQQNIREVFSTATGEQVATMARKERPDLILLDLMLPGKDGLAVLRELKQDETTRLIPVIVVSGKEAQEQVHQAMMAGAIDYVIKPFEPAELGSRIKTFLSTMNTVAHEPPPQSGKGGPH
jgi:DNA-binding response OmpR family regulator